MMQNVSGQGIDYDTFKSEFDNNPALQSLITDFDENSITISTSDDQAFAAHDPELAQANIDSSAKRAAAKMINK